jgi:hypothetical protein
MEETSLQLISSSTRKTLKRGRDLNYVDLFPTVVAKMMTKTILRFTLISCLAISAFSLYDSSSPVVSLDPTSFEKKLSVKGVWLVEFYAP